MLCCALVLVPTPLLEFRYFIVPTMLMLLHQPLGNRGTTKGDDGDAEDDGGGYDDGGRSDDGVPVLWLD